MYTCIDTELKIKKKNTQFESCDTLIYVNI